MFLGKARLSTVDTLTSIYAHCLPAEANARVALLTQIEQPLRQTKGIRQLSDVLREWLRLVALAQRKGALPDPQRLLKVVTDAVEPIAKNDAPFAIAYEQHRRSMKITTNPTLSNVTNFAMLLSLALQEKALFENRNSTGPTGRHPHANSAWWEQGEAEESAEANAAKGKGKGRKGSKKDKGKTTPTTPRSPETTPNPKAKAKAKSKGKGKGKSKNIPNICPHYQSATGCKRGGECPHAHPATPGRCLNCGSPDHWAKDCAKPRRPKAKAAEPDAITTTDLP